ncbi:hypothetical protein D9758_002092 [Tetrapyrgos nigripes]|uniref:Altered inheritance of mitochondria protein 41 n=1 Tax=Tetrapyrgos nigripes TaxID=182062 RepID=A0A8H5LV42_9AGAR|nr:hypothetical protein D9758_002092 [Tetrapyrgos nigripes]
MFRRTIATQICRCRLYSTSGPEIRDALLARVKEAMKAKDTSTSTTLRSILAEINAADKTSDSKISSSAVISILRKATARRQDAAEQYTQASRPDLAEKELREVNLLSEFLPPLLSEADIDSNIRDALTTLGLNPPVNDRKVLGQLFKQFYSKVDRALVDTEVVKKRAEIIAAGSP